MIFCKDDTFFNYFYVFFPNFRKAGKFVASIKRPKIKSASALGGFAP